MTETTKTSDRPAMTADRLAAFGEAWRRGDVDALMEFMTEDCEFRASVGPEPGSTYRGHADVRRGFELILSHDAAGEGRSGITVIDGRHGASQWVLVREDGDGRRSEVHGCDIFEFDGDRIKLKDAYRKVHADLGRAARSPGA